MTKPLANMMPSCFLMFGILVTFIMNDKWCDLHKLNTDIRQKEMETSEDLINILDLSIPICINLLPF